jgi:hypothetical protein
MENHMSFEFKHFAASVKAGAPITERDTLALRQWSWADGVISKPEAEALFDLNTVGKSRSPEWIDCFVEAISIYVIETLSPAGEVSEETAAWLMGYLNKTGRIESLGEMELLVKILEKASSAPPELRTFALTQIEQIVLSGQGPTRFPGAVRPNAIDPIEAKMLRRLLFAHASTGKSLISLDEANLLFRLKDATLLHDNAPDWQTLFVQCVGCYIMEAVGASPSQFADRPEFAKMLRMIFDAPMIDLTAVQSAIDANTKIDPLERAVLSFVVREV